MVLHLNVSSEITVSQNFKQLSARIINELNVAEEKLEEFSKAKEHLTRLILNNAGGRKYNAQRGILIDIFDKAIEAMQSEIESIKDRLQNVFVLEESFATLHPKFQQVGKMIKEMVEEWQTLMAHQLALVERSEGQQEQMQLMSHFH